MDLSELAIGALKYVGAPAVIAGALAWLLKTILKEALSRESERLRSGIERDSAVALERVRQEAQAEIAKVQHQLSMELESYKVRFARLQEKRIEPLVSLFSSVAGLCSKIMVAKIVLDMESDEEWDERLETLRIDSIAVLTQYHSARIYLPGPTAQRIQSLIVSIRRGLLMYKAQAARPSSTRSRDAFKEYLGQDYKALGEELAAEVRSLLGVEELIPHVDRESKQ